MKIYANIDHIRGDYIGEECFDIELFNDKDSHVIGLWPDGETIQFTEDVYNFDFDAHPYARINTSKLMELCKNVLKHSGAGSVDGLDVTSCLDED